MALRKAYGWEETDEMGPPEVEQDYTPLGELDAPELMPEDVNPLKALDPDAVPPELKFDPRRELADILRRNPAPGPDPRVAKAMALDRKRQNEAEVREYLLAAGQRRAPNIRNLGSPETQLALSQKPQDPMSRELMAMKLLEARRGLEDPYTKRLRELTLALKEKELAKEPKDSAPDFLTPAEQASLEEQLSMAAGMPIKLPRDEQGRTRKDFVGPLNSSANMMGMMGSKEEIAALGRAAAAARAGKRGGGKPSDGKSLGASQVLEMADFETSKDQLRKLGEDFERYDVSGPGAKVLAWGSEKLGLSNDYTEFMDRALLAMQGVGKIMEGGKLQAGDETKYRSLLPRPGDSSQRAKAKIEEAISFLETLRDNRLKALAAGGYRVGGQAGDRVTVSNGIEAFEIDAADLPAAEADGFKRVP